MRRSMSRSMVLNDRRQTMTAYSRRQRSLVTVYNFELMNRHAAGYRYRKLETNSEPSFIIL
jgi:hypothetical protein